MLSQPGAWTGAPNIRQIDPNHLGFFIEIASKFPNRSSVIRRKKNLSKNKAFGKPDFELTINHLARFHRESWNKDAVGLQERKVLFQSDSDDMCFNLEETSAYPYCPESTSNEDTANQVTAQSDSAVDPESILQLDGTDPMLLDKEFLIKGRQLLKLFRFCPSCGSNIFDTAQFVTLTASGTNPIVHYTCTVCVPFEKRFEGLDETCSPPSGMSPDNYEHIAETTITKDSCFSDLSGTTRGGRVV
ncbi:hypothetical protein COOONC_06065 [Cooperia oncophora]